MPTPIGFRDPADGAPAACSRSLTGRCRLRASPRPPTPSSKWIQARPRSNCAPRNVTGSVLAGGNSARSCSVRSITRASSVTPTGYVRLGMILTEVLRPAPHRGWVERNARHLLTPIDQAHWSKLSPYEGTPEPELRVPSTISAGPRDNRPRLCKAPGTRTPGGVAMAASEKAPKIADGALVADGAGATPDRSKWTWAARHRISAVALALLSVAILAAAVAVYQHWAGDAKNIVRIELSGKPITVPAKPDTIDALVGGQGGLY